MPNEMHRPCTLPAHWKQPNGRPIEPFDAMDYLYYELRYSSNSVGAYEILLFKSTGVLRRVPFCCGEGKGDSYDYVLPSAKIECHLLSLVIAEALNAPVLTTEEVLAGLPNDAKLMTDNEENECVFPFVQKSSEGWWGCLVYSMENEEFILRPLQSTDRIKSNRCSKTAEYLLKFTLDGVRIKEGG